MLNLVGTVKKCDLHRNASIWRCCYRLALKAIVVAKIFIFLQIIYIYQSFLFILSVRIL